jgi:hypothetical protein
MVQEVSDIDLGIGAKGINNIKLKINYPVPIILKDQRTLIPSKTKQEHLTRP